MLAESMNSVTRWGCRGIVDDLFISTWDSVDLLGQVVGSLLGFHKARSSWFPLATMQRNTSDKL